MWHHQCTLQNNKHGISQLLTITWSLQFHSFHSRFRSSTEWVRDAPFFFVCLFPMAMGTCLCLVLEIVFVFCFEHELAGKPFVGMGK